MPSGWPSVNGKIQMLVPHDFIPSGLDDSERSQGVLDVRLSHLFAELAAKKSDNIVRFDLFLSYMVSNQMHWQTINLDCCPCGSSTWRDDDDPTFAVHVIDLRGLYCRSRPLA